MPANQLENITWYRDAEALDRQEPGICHSFMASLATVINYMEDGLDPAWLMGSSAFAFRIFINMGLCPSAMSMFSFHDILPEAVEQAGYKCIYVSRMWDENAQEKEKREEAHIKIREGIDRDVPAIVWDIFAAEWGVITGYDDDKKTYKTLTSQGKPSELAYKKLGKNGIDILSVTIPGEPNSRTREEIIRNSLQAAAAHAEQKEFIDERPKYQNGLAGFDLWAQIYDRWGMLVEAGKDDNIPEQSFNFLKYYAGHYYSARCYARDYLHTISDGHDSLERAARSYAKVAAFLQPLWELFPIREKPSLEDIKSLAACIRSAKAAEAEGITYIQKYLAGKEKT